MTRQERHDRAAETKKALRAEFIRAWSRGGETEASKLLKMRLKETPQQRQPIEAAFAEVRHVASIPKPSAQPVLVNA